MEEEEEEWQGRTSSSGSGIRFFFFGSDSRFSGADRNAGRSGSGGDEEKITRMIFARSFSS